VEKIVYLKNMRGVEKNQNMVKASLCRIGLIFLGTLTFFFSLVCQKRNERTSFGQGGPQLPDQVIEGFTLTQTTNGKKEWVLKAEEAANYEGRRTIELKGLRIDFFGGEETHYSTLTAERGLVNTMTHDMEARGKVLLISDDGSRLETESLKWIDNRKKIVSEELVKITKLSKGRQSVLTGKGLESDPNLDRIEIKENIHVESFPQGKKR